MTVIDYRMVTARRFPDRVEWAFENGAKLIVWLDPIMVEYREAKR